MGAAISLGITRFAFALLLPPMRSDLGWSYTLAGAMNTANALGYLLGALATPLLLRRAAPGAVMVAGAVMAPALLGYGLFGVGYIGYMTFVVALLREQGRSAGEVTLFYALLGLAVVLSSRVWAVLLDRSRGGEALARLNALLGVATLLPAVTGAWPVVLASGLLFGGVFLSVVASTTALVRHNLPQAQWASGISAFTTVFAAGQIVGPTVVGWIADGPGGLARGLVFSACALWVGAVVAWRQKPL